MDDIKFLIDANETLEYISRSLLKHQTRESEMDIKDLHHQLEDLG